MKTKYKHIHFAEAMISGVNKTYWCKNNKTDGILGLVEYYPPWRKYVFSTDGDCVFDISCLADIIDFMKQLE